jgi:hypothetical protein
MKRCPTCNQTFSETWLSFCTQDGTTLIDDSVSTSEPPPTIMSQAPPLAPNPNPQSNWNTPSGGLGSGQFPEPKPVPSAWQPPPPPVYISGQTQGLAVASMVMGIFTITIGWCYLGIVTGPIAIGLGIYTLLQIKKYPDKFGGKPMAITGIVLSSIYVLIVAFFIVVWGGLVFMQGIK